MFRGSFENSLEREEEKMLYDAISITIFNMRGDIFFFRLFVCLFAVKKKVRKKYLHIELNSRDKRGKKLIIRITRYATCYVERNFPIESIEEN